MTARPCRPKRILEINIPHPREYSMFGSKYVRDLAAEIAGEIEEEAAKSFERGEREG